MPLVSGGAGLIVGILRCVLAYPREVPTFYDEVQSMHVDPMTALKTALLGLVTLSGGLTVGNPNSNFNLKPQHPNTLILIP